MIITFPDTVDTIDNIRDAVGRDVDFYISTLSGCSACSLDPVTNTSTDSFCLVCSGLHWISTYTVDTINAHVTWGSVDRLLWETGGQIKDGDCRVQIKHTAANLSSVENADYLVVDNKKMRVEKKLFRGVPTINRILIDCSEEKSTI